MNIALFGGVFDPPHIGHQTIAQALLDQCIADQVWFVPVGLHPFGKKFSVVEDKDHRLEMLELILTENMKIERFELEHMGISYSYRTLEVLAKQYPEHNFSWVIGSDNLAKFDQWQEFEQLLQKFRVYVYPRRDFAMKPWYDGMVEIVDVEPVEVSSTMIRDRVRDGKSIKGLVSSAVDNYITMNILYVA